jgi:UDP-N-acetylglucosamine 3-dehydrogenase
MLRVGVVGLGAMGNNHVRVYSELKCNLIGVADVNPALAQEIGEKYKIPHFNDYHEFLDKVDAVSIAVPTTAHYAVAMDFLKAGVHCLVEKPIAFNLDEANKMIEMSEMNHVNLAVGHIERFNPAVVSLKREVDKGTLGKLLIISTRRVGPSVPRIRDVGIVIDSATHDIGVIRYLLNKEPVSVFSRVGSLKHDKEDHAVIVLDFDGTSACIEVNWFTPHKVRTLVATGSEGIAYLDYIEQKVTIHNSSGIQIMDIKKSEPLKTELENFLDSILEGKQPAVNGQEAKAILKIALESNHNNYFSSLPTAIDNFHTQGFSSLHRPKVVVTIPCFNTQNTIANVISKARKYADEVLVIDDGSSDMTAMTAKSMGALVISHKKNKGYGGALKSCFSAALANGADVIITIDGDGQHNPDEIPQLLDYILKKHIGSVIGSRFLTANNIPGYRRFGISVINSLWNFGSRTKLSDSQSGFRAYQKNALDNLNLSENGMSISIEIVEKLRRKGINIQEVPISCHYENNNSHINLKAVFHGLGVFYSVFKIRLKG